MYLHLAAAVLSRVTSPPHVGSLPIVMNMVMYTGTEDRLVDCSRAALVEGCSHSMDTGVYIVQLLTAVSMILFEPYFSTYKMTNTIML